MSISNNLNSTKIMFLYTIRNEPTPRELIFFIMLLIFTIFSLTLQILYYSILGAFLNGTKQLLNNNINETTSSSSELSECINYNDSYALPYLNTVALIPVIHIGFVVLYSIIIILNSANYKRAQHLQTRNRVNEADKYEIIYVYDGRSNMQTGYTYKFSLIGILIILSVFILWTLVSPIRASLEWNGYNKFSNCASLSLIDDELSNYFKLMMDNFHHLSTISIIGSIFLFSIPSLTVICIHSLFY